jgi:hypothetical protein
MMGKMAFKRPQCAGLSTKTLLRVKASRIRQQLDAIAALSRLFIAE